MTLLVGSRVELIRTSDPYTKLEPGDQGTVVYIEEGMYFGGKLTTGTVHVKWDNGSNLGLIPGEDSWRLIARPDGT